LGSLAEPSTRTWRYETRAPASDLVLGAHGEAIIVQDDLDDTYQKID
jgi:hypothetical protein